jgi:hypothetical protein
MMLSLLLSISNAQPLQGNNGEDDLTEKSSSYFWLAFCGIEYLRPLIWDFYIKWITGATAHDELPSIEMTEEAQVDILPSETEYEDHHVGNEEILPLAIPEIKKTNDHLSDTEIYIESITQNLKSYTQEISEIMTPFEGEKSRVEEEVQSSLKIDRNKLRRASKSKRASLKINREKAVQEQIRTRKLDLIDVTYNRLRLIESVRQALDTKIFSLLTLAARSSLFREKHQYSVYRLETMSSDLKNQIEGSKRSLRTLYKQITGTGFPKLPINLSSG